MSEHEAAPERAPLGSALQAAREARGLSVADVAAAINLRETVVRAIERDDFSLCGGDVYARGHVRAYARQVGLEEQPLLDAYAEQHGGATRAAAAGVPAGPAPAPAPRTVPVAPLRGRKRVDDVPFERNGPGWPLLAGAALAVVVVLLLVQLVSDLRAPGRATSEVAAPVTTPSSTASVPATSTPTSTPASPEATSGPGPTTTASPTSASVPPNGVAVALRVTGDSWVSVRDAAGRTVFSGLLSKGDARRFTDGKALRLTLGNAGAVQLTVNGKSLGSAGGNGQVVRLQFGPGDPA
jgi:cytoskeletal protein RodZ